ncbi:CorA family divalent cation transporter [Neobacillus cucumis]
MNFKHMPELSWEYGYGYALILMGIIGLSMFLLFKKKGWF